MDDKLTKAIEDYKSGRGLDISADSNHIGRRRFNKVLLQLGIKRNVQEANRLAKGKAIINDDVFNELTPEALYWIGFLYADGSIESARPRITLSITCTDKEHLRKFAEFIGRDLKVLTLSKREDTKEFSNANPLCSVKFSSTKIYERLKLLGFSNSKSSFIECHSELSHSRDFWRGVVDGDGWIYISDRKKGIGLSGTKETLVAFRGFLNNNGIPIKQNPYKDKRKNVHKMDIHGNGQNNPTVDLLYKDATVYLDRKYKIYQEWTNN
jgi:hypothetical protein